MTRSLQYPLALFCVKCERRSVYMEASEYRLICTDEECGYERVLRG